MEDEPAILSLPRGCSKSWATPCWPRAAGEAIRLAGEHAGEIDLLHDRRDGIANINTTAMRPSSIAGNQQIGQLKWGGGDRATFQAQTTTIIGCIIGKL